jgi:hypothetical protein
VEIGCTDALVFFDCRVDARAALLPESCALLERAQHLGPVLAGVDLVLMAGN